MANDCVYKIWVKGSKKACDKLVDMMPLYYGDKEVTYKAGTDDNYELIFTGDCKWYVDAYTDRDLVVQPFTEEELDAIDDGDHWNMPLEKKAVALQCDIYCGEMDIEDFQGVQYRHCTKDGNTEFLYDDEAPDQVKLNIKDYQWWED